MGAWCRYAKQEKTPIQPDIAARDVVIRGGLNIALSDPPPYTTRGNGAVNLIAGQAVGSGTLALLLIHHFAS